jgi:hypothetical protein
MIFPIQILKLDKILFLGVLTIAISCSQPFRMAEFDPNRNLSKDSLGYLLYANADYNCSVRFFGDYRFTKKKKLTSVECKDLSNRLPILRDFSSKQVLLSARTFVEPFFGVYLIHCKKQVPSVEALSRDGFKAIKLIYSPCFYKVRQKSTTQYEDGQFIVQGKKGFFIFDVQRTDSSYKDLRNDSLMLNEYAEIIKNSKFDLK